MQLDTANILCQAWSAREEMMYRMISCDGDPILTVHPGNPMLQQSLHIEDNNGEQSQKQRHSLGNDLYLELSNGPKGQAILYRQGGIIKSVALSAKVAKKLFIVESVNLGAQPTKRSSVLKISRQTIHNYRESYRYFGAEGLIYVITQTSVRIVSSSVRCILINSPEGIRLNKSQLFGRSKRNGQGTE